MTTKGVKCVRLSAEKLEPFRAQIEAAGRDFSLAAQRMGVTRAWISQIAKRLGIPSKNAPRGRTTAAMRAAIREIRSEQRARRQLWEIAMDERDAWPKDSKRCA